MPCNKICISKNYQCDKAGCVCIPTDGRTCICVCENENGDIMRCDDCKCNGSGNCRCRCDDSKCTCIETKGADCICVCRDKRGNITTCDCACSEANARCCKGSLKSCECCRENPKKEPCSGNCECDGKRNYKELSRDGRGMKAGDRYCVETKDARCCKKKVTLKSCECYNKGTEKQACGGNCKCDGKRDFKESRRAVAFSKKYKCDNAECICLPTDGKSCICVSEDENGDIVRCDDCKCNDTGNCQCKCDDSKCTCIETKGADCICVCRDQRGNITTCDCACTKAKDTECCKKELTFKSCGCCTKRPEKKTYGGNCKCSGRRDFNEPRSTLTLSKSYKCDQAGYVCLPTGGKSCICVCENEDGDIMRCDDCKCNDSGNCQCKCDDSKCTCIVTKGADCICVGLDRRGNIKTKDCCFIGPDEIECCKKEVTGKSYGYCSEELERDTRGKNCRCCKNEVFKKSCECCNEYPKKEACSCCYRSNERNDSKPSSRRTAMVSNKYKCDKDGCICIPNGENFCICICGDDSGAFQCEDCKCCLETGCCKVQVCNNYDRQQKNLCKNCECVDNKKGYKSCCFPKKEKPNGACCSKKDNDFKTCGNNTRALEFQGRRLNEKPRCCCSYDRIQEYEEIDNKQGCECVSRETRYRRVASDGCACVAKKPSNSSAGRY